MLERIQKILSRAGIASRRSAEQFMLDGRVAVNGTVVRELGEKADAAQDDIRVDGVRVRPAPQPVYLVLNKPKGIVVTRRDPEGRRTVMDLVPAVPGLFPIGRLDTNSEGLILLTNDGDFAERVAHPRYEIARVYQAKVRGLPDAATLARLRTGVRIEGERLAVDRVRVLAAEHNAWLELTLHEGRHHEVRRLLAALGHPVSKLKRVAIGTITDRGLPPGAYRPLSGAECRALLAPKASRPAPRPSTRPSPRPSTRPARRRRA